MRTNQKE